MPDHSQIKHVGQIVASALLLSAAVLLAAAGDADPRKTTPTPRSTLQLIRALAQGDHAQHERVALAVGEGGLVGALRANQNHRALTLAAIAVAPAARKSWTLLPSLVRLLSHATDRSLAVAAGQAALGIAEDLRPRQLARHDEPRQALVPLTRRLLQFARDPQRSIDLRVTAIMIAAQIFAQLDLEAPAPVGALLVDSEPAIRRAALEAAAAHPDARLLFVRLLKEDKDARVRCAAAANFCATLPSKQADARRLLADLLLRARLRKIARSEHGPLDELRDIARCLEVFAPREARQLIQRLKQP
ncbi:MAG: hypothetical protein JRH20_11455 [Deltaproteobacteria bacterium]|nr:hypothetical protein [Deltaproteobacteria bacterium]